MSNLKIGGQNVGKIYLGDTQIFGGLTNDISVKKEDTILVFINNSGFIKTINIYDFSSGQTEVIETFVIHPGGVIAKTYMGELCDGACGIKEASTAYVWNAYNEEQDTPVVQKVYERSFVQDESITFMYYSQYDQICVVYITA